MKDINSATQQELEQVPLISPARAASIIDWRDNHGPIDDMDQLTEVPGIGERMLQRMSEHFSVASGTQQPPGDDPDEENEPDEGDEPDEGENQPDKPDTA